MQDPRIPNFYLTSLESGPFLDDFDEPPCPKTPRRDRFSRNPLFWGPSLTPRAAESVSPAKNYMQGGKWALKISRQSVQRVTSYGTFLKWHTDGQTDTRTKTNHLSTTTEFFLHVCEWEGGKLYKTYQISTSSLCEGLQFVMHDLELDSNFLTRYSLLNFALKFVFLVKVMNFLNFGKILLH